MHEVALAEGVLRIVLDAARANAARSIRAVRVELGALAHVELDALAFCFDAVTRGSLAEGAKLEILRTEGAAWCMPCGGRVPLARVDDACPRCGSHQLRIVEGEDMRVIDIAIG